MEIAQKERWILDRLHQRYGGTVRYRARRPEKGENPLWVWTLAPVRARGFLMTIYGFLSPHRKAGAKKALNESIGRNLHRNPIAGCSVEA